ncbi:WSC domain-containing protein [Rutstroemia sp. NJR-2017a BVV2]|nr:WSC domain-containing protein [Rutstroemia sp. NJR-2017a BVV2]
MIFLRLSAASGNVRQTGLEISSILPEPWMSRGCYFDVGRTLTDGQYIDNVSMTDESCISYCSSKGLNYAGTEYSSECYCGNTLTSGAGPAPALDCKMPCSGNSSEPCGGPSRLNLFWNGKAPPQTNPGTGLWNFSGCYTEGQGGRTLVYQEATSNASQMSVSLCTSACAAAGYNLAGLEYATECWCGNSLSNGGVLAPEGISGCSTLCSGNSSEYCGGTNRLDIYNYNNAAITSDPMATSTANPSASPTVPPSIQQTIGAYNYYGCRTEGVDARALSSKASADSSMSLEACEASCVGYTYFGTEYGRECYCGNSFSNGSISAVDAECNFPCAGNSSEFCGASGRLSVYQLNTTLGDTIPPPNTAPHVSNLPAGWIYDGCCVDSPSRVLKYQQPDNQNLTVEYCVAICITLNYQIAGLEYGSQCFCDNVIESGGILATSPADCNMPCSGSVTEICGASNRLSVYSNGTVQTSQKAGYLGNGNTKVVLSQSVLENTFGRILADG